MSEILPPGPAAGLRTHWCGELRAADIGTEVSLCGWVENRREHGEHLAFIDLRDRTGITQCVVAKAHDLRNEYALRISGTVRARFEGATNDKLATGEIELQDCTVEVLSRSEPPPFPIHERTEPGGGSPAPMRIRRVSSVSILSTTRPGAWNTRTALFCMTGDMMLGRPRVMQRSNVSRSVIQSMSAVFTQLDLPALSRASAAGVSGGSRPLSGSTISEVRRPSRCVRTQSARPAILPTTSLS